MSADPFNTFATSVTTSLNTTQDLSRQYLSLLRSSSSRSSSSQDEIRTAHDRFLDALDALKSDVEDVRQSINVVKRSPERFGVDHQEMTRRQAFLTTCQSSLEALEREAAASQSKRDFTALQLGQDDEQDDDDENQQNAFEREHQQSLMSNQDSILSTIGRTLTSLHSQASTMGHELNEQNELVQQFDSEVEHSSTRLTKAMDRMNDFTRRADGWTGGWTIWILIVLLFFLLLVAILI